MERSDMDKVRYKAVVAYDGTAFSGMQRQKNGRSIQSAVEDALSSIGWRGKSILAAGRTDAGVHASGQVIAFDLDWKHSLDELQRAMNTGLPADVAIKRVERAKNDFHPRYDAKSRRYQYRLFCQSQRDPLRERYAWRVWPEVKLSLLKAAAKPLRGEHDFVALGSSPKEGGGTTRKVLSANWRRITEDEYLFEVSANAFLYHMVRRMVGLQVKIGQGLAAPNAMAEALKNKNKVRELAPPQGLCLVAVEY
jgi:tRNA pseudouridine38-40 synthase